MRFLRSVKFYQVNQESQESRIKDARSLLLLCRRYERSDWISLQHRSVQSLCHGYPIQDSA